MVTLKGLEIDVQGKLPSLGTKAPRITGIDGDWKERSLDEFKGQKKIVCFVPSLDTSVCSTSAQKFNQKVETTPNVAVIYCSMDLPFVFKRVCENFSHITSLSLLRSPQVAQDYGSFQAGGPIRGLCARSVFVLDENDKILYYELVPEITSEPNYDKALSFIADI